VPHIAKLQKVIQHITDGKYKVSLSEKSPFLKHHQLCTGR